MKYITLIFFVGSISFAAIGFNQEDLLAWAIASGSLVAFFCSLYLIYVESEWLPDALSSFVIFMIACILSWVIHICFMFPVTQSISILLALNCIGLAGQAMYVYKKS